MDSLMLKLFDDDENESVQYGGEVDAFAAALHRELKGETSFSQALYCDDGVLSRGSIHTSGQLFAQRQYSIREENIMIQYQEEGRKNLKQQEHHSSEIYMVQHGCGSYIQQQQTKSVEHSLLQLQLNQSGIDHQLQLQADQNATQFYQNSAVQICEQNTAHIPHQDRKWHPDYQLQYPKLQNTNNKQSPPAGQTNNRSNSKNQVTFGMLIPPLLAQLDKDRAMQLKYLVCKVASKEISSNGFLWLVRSLVGSHLFRRVAKKLLAQVAAKDQAAWDSQTGAHQMQVPSTATPVEANVETPPKMPSIGQKKPVDALGTPSPVARKKAKLFGVYLDQSTEQLHDFTAVSGVNLREEEEKLSSRPEEENQASEASRMVVQVEEHKLILQKNPLQRKLAKIMSNCAIKNLSNDVEHCLSLCVEERMRGLIKNLISLSKQMVDIERPRHQTIITSDVRRQIFILNQMAKDNWEKKVEEAEELQKLYEAEENGEVDGAKDEDECHSKALKEHKEEVGIMTTTAAIVAARVAVGGDDMLLKWKRMAEQAQRKHGQRDVAYAVQSGKDATHKSLSTSGQTLQNRQCAESRGPYTAASGGRGEIGTDSVRPLKKIERSISIKDVLAVLEREPQMSKSTLIYRLYERVHADSAAKGFYDMKCKANERFVQMSNIAVENRFCGF